MSAVALRQSLVAVFRLLKNRGGWEERKPLLVKQHNSSGRGVRGGEEGGFTIRMMFFLDGREMKAGGGEGRGKGW